MKKTLSVLFALSFTLTSHVGAAQSKSAAPTVLKELEGPVEMKPTRESAWKLAKKGDPIPEGASLRTGPDARATLRFHNKTSMWLKPSTQVAMTSQGLKNNRIELQAGAIKVRVPHLRRSEKFEVRGPQAVASVRGTVYTMELQQLYEAHFGRPTDQTGLANWEAQVQQAKVGNINPVAPGISEQTAKLLDAFKTPMSNPTPFTQAPPISDTIGKALGEAVKEPPSELTTKVQVLFGQVDMKFDDGRTLKLPQGMGLGDDGRLTMLKGVEEAEALKDWAPAMTEAKRMENLVNMVTNRQEIRDFAHDALARNEEVIESMAGKVKEEDFAAGRTLTDVHGNLVRVEQRLDRPDNKTIQITNIVKRTSYASGGLRKYSYHGPSTARTDALIAKTEFNQALPDQINAFPGFFSANEETLKIDRASMVLANMADDNQIATMAFLGKRNAGTSTDDIDSDLYAGGLNGKGALFSLSMDNALSLGLTRYRADNATDSINHDGVNGELYGNAAKRFSKLTGSGPAAVWVCTESFVINNGGRVRNIADYTSGGANIQELLSNSAGQTVVFMKGESAGLPDNGISGDVLPGQKNIDLVIIPDLFYSVVKSLASSADKFKTTY
jgi:hypothetical protein